MLTENFVTRVTVRHHEACRNFQFASKNHYGFFFLHTLPSTTAFRLEYLLLYQVYAKITTFFDQEKFGTAPLLYTDIETFGGRENDVKIVMHESRLTSPPPCKTKLSSLGRVHRNPGRVCKKYVIRLTNVLILWVIWQTMLKLCIIIFDLL